MRAPTSVTGALLIAALGASVTSCAKTGADSETSPAAGQNISSWREVRIYHHTQPQCDFVEVRWVRVVTRGGYGHRLRRAVKDAGGDAAINVTSIQGDTGVIGYEGMAIRFTDPECTR